MEMKMELGKWDWVGYSVQSLSEMFQKVQLAAMKNDKFHWVVTVNPKPKPIPNLNRKSTRTKGNPKTTPHFFARFSLLALFYYLSSLLRKQQLHPGA